MIDMREKTIATYDSLGVLTRRYICKNLRRWLHDACNHHDLSFDENEWYVLSIECCILGSYASGEGVLEHKD